MANPTMTFDLARLERFRQARNEAQAADQDSFEFDGHPFLVRYADYLILYLDGKINNLDNAFFLQQRHLKRVVRDTLKEDDNA